MAALYPPALPRSRLPKRPPNPGLFPPGRPRSRRSQLPVSPDRVRPGRHPSAAAPSTTATSPARNEPSTAPRSTSGCGTSGSTACCPAPWTPSRASPRGVGHGGSPGVFHLHVCARHDHPARQIAEASSGLDTHNSCHPPSVIHEYQHRATRAAREIAGLAKAHEHIGFFKVRQSQVISPIQTPEK